MFTDQRAHERVSFFLLDKGKQPVWAFPLKKESTAGIILDFSPFGGRLLFPPQANLLLEREELLITLHDTTDKNGTSFQIQVKVLWHKKQVATNNTEVGCQFIKTTKEEKLKLMELISTAKKQTQQLIVRCEMA